MITKKSEELEALLIEARAELEDLLDEEQKIKSRASVLRSEITDLSGGIGKLGRILSLKRDLKKALMEEKG